MTVMYQHHLYTSVSIIYRLITDPHNDQLPVDLIAQVVEHYTGIVEVMVRIPVRLSSLRLKQR